MVHTLFFIFIRSRCTLKNVFNFEVITFDDYNRNAQVLGKPPVDSVMLSVFNRFFKCLWYIEEAKSKFKNN